MTFVKLIMDHHSYLAARALCVATAHERESAEMMEIKRLQKEVKKLRNQNSELQRDRDDIKDMLQQIMQLLMIEGRYGEE